MIVVVMGVSGSGKSTVGAALARALGWPFLDADDFHPPQNVAKMAAGTPLTDDDRATARDTPAPLHAGEPAGEPVRHARSARRRDRCRCSRKRRRAGGSNHR